MINKYFKLKFIFNYNTKKKLNYNKLFKCLNSITFNILRIKIVRFIIINKII